ncbi:glycoside hydrolase family 88 protein [bacterium]|nr:glycoside hydrolase family 88 protein [bacterium]
MDGSRWDEAIARMRARIDRTAATVRGGFPHYAEPAAGLWTVTPHGDWTGGYWNGMLWLTAAATGDDRYARLAGEWMERLRPRIDSQTSARGLLFYYGAALGAILTGNSVARELGIAAARSLAAGYNPQAEVIPMGAEFEEVHSVGLGESEVDVVQIAALLGWAARETGEARLREIGARHARRHIEFCLRADGSICQSASFDPATGKMTRRYTHKGISDSSTWARAQAWGILGWALAAHWTGDMTLLEPAERAAHWWNAHVPPDRVAYWDFDDPAIPHTNRDTSATAIAAAGMLKLAELATGEVRRYAFRQAAESAVGALVENFLGKEGGLWQGCYNKRIELATAHELIWGTYYLYESLHVLAGKIDAIKV